MAKRRIPMDPDISTRVLFDSDRTCCVCRERGKRVQIHHLDEDPSNNQLDNLSVLCFDCHNESQVRGVFGKHLTAPLIIQYRDEWLRRVKMRRDETDKFAISKMTNTRVVQTNRENDFPQQTNIYSYLDSIPEVKKDLLVKAQLGWDTGITAQMNQASYDYIDGLRGILIGLASFYSPSAFDNQEPHDFFSEIISTRFRWHRSHTEPDGPGTGGIIVVTICCGSVISDVEKMIEDMVYSLVDFSDEYSWKDWKRRWKSA